MMNGSGASMFTERVSMQLNPNRTVLAGVFGAIAMAAVLAAGPLVAAGEVFREIRVEPSPLVFSGPGSARRILVTGIMTTGEKRDLTAEARYDDPAGLVEVQGNGFLHPREPGETTLQVTAEALSVDLPVRIEPAREQPTTFLKDVLPVINKVGCTNGMCHGAAKGKNGFKLSLRGYDPRFDYQSLLYDMSGRRFNRADPARSLMLAKPAQQVAHGGGLRLPPDSPYYDTLLQWITDGVPFGEESTDRVRRLEVLPEEVFLTAPGQKQSVVILAEYVDGSLRDVTREAHLGSSNTEAIAVTDGAVVEGERVGEGALLVRYEGKFVTVPVTVLNPSSGFEWRPLPQYNYIDRLVDGKLERIRVQPSPPASDSNFLRRVSLDLTGRLPRPEEVRAFLEDPAGPQEKRREVIDRLMGSDAYVDHWTLKWGDLLRNNRKFLGHKGIWSFQEWIRQSVAENKPYHELVRELLASKGSTGENPAVNYFRVARTPQDAMETTTQLFLGVRMVCAQCHDHPFERWTQDQYFQMAAFFSAIGIRPGFKSGEEIVYEKRRDAELKHPKDGRVVEPEYLVPVKGAPAVKGEGDQRPALVEWLTSKENPFFARAVANRVWSYFFGRGIIEPVDDIRASNPAVNAPLLDALAQDLKDHDYDLQHLMRTIVESRTYQASIRTNSWNENDGINFSRRIPRRLSAEQLADAISAATGSRVEFETVPDDSRAAQLPDPHVENGEFLDLFGRPQRDQPCECERKSDMSLSQALNLVNGPTVGRAVADPEGRIASLVLEGVSDRELIEDLYLSTLSRPPTAPEFASAALLFQERESRAGTAQDLLWALLNSNAFLFNR